MISRHITLSTQQGMVTELELMGQGFGPGEQYILRYHQTAPNSTDRLEMVIPEAPSAPWSGFRYRNNEISVLMVRQGPAAAKA
ncbi:MAG TPA: hypothetical protein VGK48_27335 [Terriglobia bacterium]